MMKIRKSSERGYFDHGWLKSFHTFSFADYFDRHHMNFGNLRVINEDYIAAAAGFGKHPHADMEIITYVISGALAHEDSMGNSSTILPGEVQVMSAGSGVRHSEFNQKKDEETHLLQIWILPEKKGIEPRYDQKSFADDLEKNEFVKVVSKSGSGGSLAINQDAEIFVGKFPTGKKHEMKVKKDRKIWIQVVNGEISINGATLEKGDAAAFEDEEKIEIEAKRRSEFLLFDL